jgi:hypothetical protein
MKIILEKSVTERKDELVTKLANALMTLHSVNKEEKVQKEPVRVRLGKRIAGISN